MKRVGLITFFFALLLPFNLQAQKGSHGSSSRSSSHPSSRSSSTSKSSTKSSGSGKTVHVKEHVRKDGTVVKAHDPVGARNKEFVQDFIVRVVFWHPEPIHSSSPGWSRPDQAECRRPERVHEEQRPCQRPKGVRCRPHCSAGVWRRRCAFQHAVADGPRSEDQEQDRTKLPAGIKNPNGTSGVEAGFYQGTCPRCRLPTSGNGPSGATSP